MASAPSPILFILVCNVVWFIFLMVLKAVMIIWPDGADHVSEMFCISEHDQKSMISDIPIRPNHILFTTMLLLARDGLRPTRHPVGSNPCLAAANNIVVSLVLGEKYRVMVSVIGLATQSETVRACIIIITAALLALTYNPNNKLFK